MENKNISKVDKLISRRKIDARYNEDFRSQTKQNLRYFDQYRPQVLCFPSIDNV